MRGTGIESRPVDFARREVPCLYVHSDYYG